MSFFENLRKTAEDMIDSLSHSTEESNTSGFFEKFGETLNKLTDSRGAFYGEEKTSWEKLIEKFRNVGKDNDMFY